MSSHCLQEWPLSSFSQLLHPCIPSSPPGHPGPLHASFPCSYVHICFLHNFPGPAIPANTQWSANTQLQVRFHLTNTGSVKGGLGQSPTQSSKTQIAGKWCLRPQAPCLCYSSKFRHEILPTFLFSHQQHHIMSDMNQEEGAAQGVNYHPWCSIPWMCSCKYKGGTCWMHNNRIELGEA